MRLLHLYYDIMNLYGEYGNVSVLERILAESHSEFTTDRLSIYDKADINSYDFIFIGSGTERNQKLVLEDMKKYKDELIKYIDNSKLLLMTGNSFEMLGKSITDYNGNEYEGLALFDFNTIEQNKKRITSDVILTSDLIKYEIVGFINKCSEIYGISSPLFTVKYGIGDNIDSKTEGIHYKNLFASHTVGPLLVKNPHFLQYITEIISKNTTSFEVCSDHLYYELKAYDTTLSELNKRYKNNISGKR